MLVCSIVSVFAIMFLTTFNALARKIFNYSIPSLFEFTADYLMVALVFLPLSYIYVNDGHIRVTLFLKFVPKVITPVMDKLLGLTAFVLFVLITIMGWNNAVRAFQFNEISSNLVGYPMGLSYLLVPIGAGMLAIRIFQSIISPQSIKIHYHTEGYID